jgi:septum formation protein
VILLASNSVTRAKILDDFKVDFIQKGFDFDEDSIVSSSAKNFVYQATLGKYELCRLSEGLKIPILVADTVVTAEDKILRKAKDRSDARKILYTQSGKSVSIITCMIYESKSMKLIDLSSTEYIFKKFDEDELEAYLDSGEWMGKAGACMVEGFCKKYIKEVRGLESTAMGLSIEKLLPFIR